MSAPEPRRVLIATVSMTTASGTVTYTRDLALALLRRGWLPIVYTTRTGPQADVLRRASIPVVTTLSSVGAPPDVIHGHHALETLSALARFPNVPALFVCHDGLTWHSIPPKSPRIRAFVAVDRNCRDRMVFEHGFSPESVQVLANVVDLARFRRRTPLPAKPKRALVFSNMAMENSFVAPIREACAARGIEVDVVGLASGGQVDHPEDILPEYDLVFAKARCAIEASAVGAAVIGCDAVGMSGMITSTRFDEMHVLNFGRRTLQLPMTPENLLQEIDRYDPADAAAVSERIRASNDSDLIAQQFVSIYDEILLDPVRWSDEELPAFSDSLETIAHHLYAQMEAGSKQYEMLARLFNSKGLGPLLRFAWRAKKRIHR